MKKVSGQPLLSIVTVCLNEPQLERTCESIINQTFQNFEWIVIDGGSNAETLAVFERYKYRIDCFVSEKDNGVYEAMNKGIERSRGIWLNFMNAGDTFAYEYILEHASKMLIQRPDIDVFYGEVFKKTQINCVVTCTPDDDLNKHFFTNTIPHQSAFINRSCFLKYGNYDTELKIVSDYKFFLMLYKKNAKFLRWNCIVANMDGGGISTQYETLQKERILVVNQFYSAKEIKMFKKKSNPINSVAANLRARLLAKKRSCQNHPKISIIIPVYNTGAYLRRCLDSVCAQTLDNFEIICVNDGSDDNSFFVLREYAIQDSRVLLINFSRNKGVSAARNAGIAVARGEYLGFVDSDDVIDKDFYEKLYARALESDAPIIKGVRTKINEDDTVMDDPINDKIRKGKFNFYAQWTTAIYRTRFIRDNGIHCPLGVTNNEDVAFVLKAVTLVPRVEIVDDAFYRYCRRTGSASSDVLSLARIFSALQAHGDIIAFLNTRGVSVHDYDALFLQCLFLSCHLNTRSCPEEHKEAALACAQAAVKQYSACRRPEALDAGLLKTRPDWLPFLRGGDAVGLAGQLLTTPQARMQKNASALRARLKADYEEFSSKSTV